MNWKSQPLTFQGFRLCAESKPLENPYYLIIHLKTCHNKKLPNEQLPLVSQKYTTKWAQKEQFNMH